MRKPVWGLFTNRVKSPCKVKTYNDAEATRKLRRPYDTFFLAAYELVSIYDTAIINCRES